MIRDALRVMTVTLSTLLLLGTQASAAEGDPLKAVTEFMPTCAPRFSELDTQVEKAKVGDATYLKIDGFPYLRTDRMLASFDEELKDIEVYDTWLLALRDNDSYARRIELDNLGMSLNERSTAVSDMRLCAVWLSFFDLSDPERLEELLAAVSKAKATAHLQAQTPAPLPDPSPRSGELTQLTAIVGEAIDDALKNFALMPRDSLSRTGFTDDGWLALAAHHAPTWLIEKADKGDRPGAVRVNEGNEIVLDTRTPTVYFMPHFARAGETSLIQFHYFLWFERDDGQGIDGLIWRVTLDSGGHPLIYDSLRADGSDHRWHQAQTLKAKDVLPKNVRVTAPIGTQGAVVTLAPSGSQVRSVSPRPDAMNAQGVTYRLEPYESLMTLPRPNGGTTSAFDPQGRFRLMAAGGRVIPQWGSHPPLPLYGLMYDDPHLIEASFELATSLSSTAAIEPSARELTRR